MFKVPLLFLKFVVKHQMSKKFEKKLQLGNGIFTTAEIAQILRLPYQKTHTWINKYWDGELGKTYEHNYSWIVNNTRAVGFHTLIEFYVMLQFAEAGVTTRQVLNAHKELSKSFNTPFPFAQKMVLANIHTDGTKIYLTKNDHTLTLDGTKQLNLAFIKVFFKKLEFGDDLIAAKYWPMGKKCKIVCDPHHKFGQPTIQGTNIQAEAIYRMFVAHEPVTFIADVYNITPKNVKDAVAFYKTAA
jgi:uncharacterized protein (DUF433 family)